MQIPGSFMQNKGPGFKRDLFLIVTWLRCCNVRKRGIFYTVMKFLSSYFYLLLFFALLCLVFCFFFKDVFSTLDCGVWRHLLRWSVKSELQRLWVFFFLPYCYCDRLECLRIVTKILMIMITHTDARTHSHIKYHALFPLTSLRCEKRLVVSSCSSVCPHGTTRLALDGFSRN